MGKQDFENKSEKKKKEICLSISSCTHLSLEHSCFSVDCVLFVYFRERERWRVSYQLLITACQIRSQENNNKKEGKKKQQPQTQHSLGQLPIHYDFAHLSSFNGSNYK